MIWQYQGHKISKTIYAIVLPKKESIYILLVEWVHRSKREHLKGVNHISEVYLFDYSYRIYDNYNVYVYPDASL